MSNIVKLNNDNYLDSSSIVHYNNLLNKVIPRRIIANGQRSTVYLIGSGLASTSGSESASQLTLFCSNADFYDYAKPVIYNIAQAGQGVTCFSLTNANLSSWKKTLYVYKDTTRYYVFLNSPNYNDNWFVDVLVNYHFNYSYREMTTTEFNNYVSEMTLVSQV